MSRYLSKCISWNISTGNVVIPLLCKVRVVRLFRSARNDDSSVSLRLLCSKRSDSIPEAPINSSIWYRGMLGRGQNMNDTRGVGPTCIPDSRS